MKTRYLLLLPLYCLFYFSAAAQWQDVGISGKCFYVKNNLLYVGAQIHGNPSGTNKLFVSSDGVNFNGFLIDENRDVLISAITITLNNKILIGSDAGLYQGEGAIYSRVNGFPPAGILSLISKETLIEPNIYAGTDTKGIYISSDQGSTWTSTNGVAEPAYCIIASGAFDYNAEMLAATAGGGIYRTTDGKTWSKSNFGLGSLKTYSLCKLNGKIFVGTESGIYASSNGGQQWSNLTMDLANTRTLIASGSLLFAGLQNNGGVYYSSNEGATWINITKDVPNKNIYSLASYNSWLYAATDGGVFKIHRDSIQGKIISVDSTYHIYSGMDTALNVNIGSGLRKYDFSYTIAGKTQPVVDGAFNFTKNNDITTSYCRWQAPYTDAEAAKLDGSSDSKKLIVSCVVSDLNDATKIYGTARFSISVIPALIKPDLGAQNIDPKKPLYAWHKIPNVKSYILEVKPMNGIYPTQGDATADTTLDSAPQLTLTNCLTFFWRVRANNSSGPIIGERSFTTKCNSLDWSQNFKDTSMCKSGIIRLRATGQDGKIFLTPGRPYQYLWKMEDGGDIPAVLKVAGGGFYEDTLILNLASSVKIKCEIRDQANNVTAHFSITIGSSSAKIQTTSDKLYICKGGNMDLALNKSFQSVRWFKNGSQISVSPTCTITSSGQYTAIAKEADGCEATDTINITERPLPKPEIDGRNSACVSAQSSSYSINLNSAEISSLTWNVVSGQSLVNAADFTKNGKLVFLSKGEVVIRANVIDTAGCSGASDDYKITIGDSLHPVISGPSSFCKGSSINLNIGQADSVQWFRDGAILPGEKTRTLIVTQAGIYKARIVSGICSGFSDAATIYEAQSPNAAITINSNGELSVSDGSIWQWYRGKDALAGNEISGASNRTYTPDTTGDFSVKVTTDSGCSSIGSIYLPPAKTIANIGITDASGGDIRNMSFSKNLQDYRVLQLRAANFDAGEAITLGVAAYRITLDWDAQTLGMANPPAPIVIENGKAKLEYDIEANKFSDGAIGEYSFLALIGGKDNATVTPTAIAMDVNKQPIRRAFIAAQAANFGIDSVPAKLQRNPTFILSGARPNPTNNEITVEISSKTGELPINLEAYLTDASGKKALMLVKKQSGLYWGDCSNLSTGAYLLIATDGISKQMLNVQIKR